MFNNLTKSLELAKIEGPFQVHTEMGLAHLDLKIHQIFVSADKYQNLLCKHLCDFYPAQAEINIYDVAQQNYRSILIQDLHKEKLGSDSILIVNPQSDLHSGGLNGLVQIIDRLYAPGGCPWDQAQTHESLKKYLIEEAYEVIDAIDSHNESGLKEELGDLLLQPLLHTQMEESKGNWGAAQVANQLIDKLIRRHPHVFAETIVDGSEEVLKNWDQIKKKEKGESGSILGDLPHTLPSLLFAMQISKRAARVGFEWDKVEDIFDKLFEEIQELRNAMALENTDEIELELGDILFCIVNIARRLKIEPEQALHRTTKKFIKRFQWMEQSAKKPLSELTLAQLEALWVQAKALSKANAKIT